jgi:hypothetical protein
MSDFDKIYLSWRKGPGYGRYIVGLLDHRSDGSFSFSYDPDVVGRAKRDGFTPYTEFPDVSKTYNGNVMDIFAQRLIKSERPDVAKFYSFWEIDEQFQDDKFYLLGHTQGLLPTDNFEFLADYNMINGLHFLTEIAGLTPLRVPSDVLNEGDELTFKIDRNNEFDPEAVKVYKGQREIGFIKRIHCKLFHKPGAENLKLQVKAIEKNGYLRRVFIKVSL